MPVASLAGVILGVLGLVGVGLLLRASGLLKPEDARPINNVIIYAGLPALIFQAVHPARLEPGLLLVAAIAWVAVAFGMLVAWVVGRLLRLPRPTIGALMLVSALGNTGYIGYPLAQGLLGQDGLVRAVFYDVFGTVGALLTLGLAVCAHFGDSDERVRPLREILRFPALLALVLAVLLQPVDVPILVSRGLGALASLVVPLIMFSLALSIRRGSFSGRWPALGAVAVTKLVVLPALALAIGVVLLREPAALRLVALQAGTPSMMLALVFGSRYRLDPGFIAAAILVTTAASLATVPLFQLIIR